ncbi:MAG: thiol:disulfide interchange protein TlpA [Methyloligellaceae bacterium]
MSAEETHGQKSKTSPATYLWVAALAAVAGFVAVYVNFGSDGNVTSPKPQATADRPAAAPAGGLDGLNRGDMAAFVVRSAPEDVPDFTFNADGGQEKSLAEWKGKVVLLNLWATWCAPCRKEMPALDKLKADLGGEDFDVVAISIDRGGFDKPRAFLKQIKVGHLKLYNEPSGKIGPKLKAFGMPTTLLIDRNGKEIGRLIGPAEWHSEDAVKLLKAAIGKG